MSETTTSNDPAFERLERRRSAGHEDHVPAPPVAPHEIPEPIEDSGLVVNKEDALHATFQFASLKTGRPTTELVVSPTRRREVTLPWRDQA